MACREAIRVLLKPRARRVRPKPRIMNEDDAITLEPVDPWAATTFLSYLADQHAAYAHDAPGLFRFCCESPGAPRDPVTMREFDAAELAWLEIVAGQPDGEIARQRGVLAAERTFEAAENDLSNPDNQEMLAEMLLNTIDRALATVLDTPMQSFELAIFLHHIFMPAIDAILMHLQVDQDFMVRVHRQVIYACAVRPDFDPMAAAMLFDVLIQRVS